MSKKLVNLKQKFRKWRKLSFRPSSLHILIQFKWKRRRASSLISKWTTSALRTCLKQSITQIKAKMLLPSYRKSTKSSLRNKTKQIQLWKARAEQSLKAPPKTRVEMLEVMLHKLLLELQPKSKRLLRWHRLTYSAKLILKSKGGSIVKSRQAVLRIANRPRYTTGSPRESVATPSITPLIESLAYTTSTAKLKSSP